MARLVLYYIPTDFLILIVSFLERRTARQYGTTISPCKLEYCFDSCPGSSYHTYCSILHEVLSCEPTTEKFPSWASDSPVHWKFTPAANSEDLPQVCNGT